MMTIFAHLKNTSKKFGCPSEIEVMETLSRAVYGTEKKGIRQAKVIRAQSQVADGAAIFELDRDYVLFVSPDAFPEVAEEQRGAMVRMAEALEFPLNKMILPVIGSGYLGRRSFLVLPRCKPLSKNRLFRRLQKPSVTRRLLPWLRELTEAAPRTSQDRSNFVTSLDALQRFSELPPDLLADAASIKDAIVSGEIAPRHCPMHGDLWSDNIMIQQNGDFAIIDWAGSECQGYAVYDLIRLHQSLNLSMAKLTSELGWYSDKLGGKLAVKAHLLGAVGHYGNQLGEFPRDRFVKLASNCYHSLLVGLEPLPGR